MAPSHFSIATTSQLVRLLSFKEMIRCLTYLDRAAMMHHTNLRMYKHVYTRTAVPLLLKMQKLPIC